MSKFIDLYNRERIDLKSKRLNSFMVNNSSSKEGLKFKCRAIKRMDSSTIAQIN